MIEPFNSIVEASYVDTLKVEPVYSKVEFANLKAELISLNQK